MLAIALGAAWVYVLVIAIQPIIIAGRVLSAKEQLYALLGCRHLNSCAFLAF